MELIAYSGFLLAAYSVIGNDVIQTLGTFLTSNARRPWWLLWAYAGLILSAVLIFGWHTNGGDVSYARLSKIPFPDQLTWWYLLPPLTLMTITRYGIPVSTTFMILTVFSSGQIIEKMVMKSVFGYGIAFTVAIAFYLVISKRMESKESLDTLRQTGREKWWIIAQWFSTGFLWTQWLIQDFANIYVYLPRQLSLMELFGSLAVILSILAFIFKSKGGKIQQVVINKANSENIRSATLIDFCYGVVLYIFTEINPVPMSTTWTFVGILAGREIAIKYVQRKGLNSTYQVIFWDLLKVILGLIVSVALAYLIIYIK